MVQDTADCKRDFPADTHTRHRASKTRVGVVHFADSMATAWIKATVTLQTPRKIADTQHARVCTSVDIKWERWWARLGLNQRPLRCQHSALPLSYAPHLIRVSASPTALFAIHRRQGRVIHRTPPNGKSLTSRLNAVSACTRSRSQELESSLTFWFHDTHPLLH